MKKLIIYILSSMFIFTSCENIVDGLNDDPNNYTDTDVNLLLNHVFLNFASIVESDPARYTCMFTDQLKGADRQYATVDGYGVSQASFDDHWSYIFSRGVAQAQIAKEKAKESGNKVIEGQAEVCEAFYFGEGALLFGDIPFTEANKSAAPKYDKQADVLKGAIKLIDDAIAKLGDSKASNNVFASESSFAQFAYALKARYSLALKDYPNALASATSANFTSRASNVSIKHTAANNSENLFWQFQVEQRGGYLKVALPKTKTSPAKFSYMLELLDSTNVNFKGNTKTNESGRYSYYAKGENLNTDDGFFAQTAAFPIVSFEEVQLIIAEAQARANKNTEALVALNNVRSSNATKFEKKYDKYVLSDFGASGVANPKNLGTEKEALLREILLEKYCSVIGNPTFYDVNRTKNLIGVPIKKDGAKSIPQRFLYPSTESSSNENVPNPLPDLYDPTPVNK